MKSFEFFLYEKYVIYPTFYGSYTLGVWQWSLEPGTGQSGLPWEDGSDALVVRTGCSVLWGIIEMLAQVP